jgi:hypothetical protein
MDRQQTLDTIAMVVLGSMIMGLCVLVFTQQVKYFDDPAKYCLLTGPAIYLGLLLRYKQITSALWLLMVLFAFLQFPVIGAFGLVVLDIFARRL